MINKITLPELLGPVYQLNLPYIKAVLKGEKQVFERQLNLPNGETKNTIATYIPDEANGKVNGFYVHVADISMVKIPNQEIKGSTDGNPGSFKSLDAVERIERELRNSVLKTFPGIAQLAKTVFLSESTIKRLFKERYKCNIYFYFRNLQMILAEKYLTEKQFNRKQLADMFGFSKPSNFSTCYNTYLNKKNTNTQLEVLKQANDELYRSFIEKSPFAMALIDSHMRYLSVSAEWKNEYKMVKGRTVGEFCRNFLFSDNKKWKTVFKSCLQGRVYNGEAEFKDFHNNISWLRWEIRPWYNRMQICGALLFIQNITHQKVGDVESRKIFEILEMAGGIARIGTWKRNFKTKKSLWSKVTKEIFEVPDHFSADLQETLTFYPEGESRNLMQAVLHNAIQNGQSFDIQTNIVTAKGKKRTVRIVGYSDFKNGKCERLFGIIQDVTVYRMKQKKLVSFL